MWVLAVGVALWALFAWRMWRAPGRAYNGTLLVVAALTTWLGLIVALEVVGQDLAARVLAFGGILLGPLAVAGATGWLLVNGVVVMRREGIRTSTVLPLAFGTASLLILGMPFAVAALYDGPALPTWLVVAGWVVVLGYVYVGFHLLAYTAYAVAYARLPEVRGVDAVVVLGAGLSRGYAVTPLLAGRLRRGLQVYQEERARGGAPVLVTSGGQGPDEQRPEAVAMAEWLEDQGVAPADLLRESRSTTTQENLELSRDLLGERADGTVVVATSSYHVLRTAALARKVGLPWRVVGAPTASYYTPTAFLREFIAHLSYGWTWHAAVTAVMVAGVLGLWSVTILIS